MTTDERAIRDLIENWLALSSAGDMSKVLTLMTDDVVFMVPGQEPFGKEAFASRGDELKNARLEAKSEVVELKVLGDWAWCRTRLQVSITPPNGKPNRRAGYTMSILQKRPDGSWALARDANLLAPEPAGAARASV
jgi:uncharacterized protein (TIGR02246 family)